MANLLNFNSTRDLGFSHARELQFDLNRELVFDANRDLTFDPNRDLGFGRRGVLFRGYVCPTCGALVSAGATSCSECGARFDEPEVRGAPLEESVKTSGFEREETATPTPESPSTPPRERRAPPPPPPQARRQAPPPPPAPAPALTSPPMSASPASRFCPNCGARSWQGDAFCWNCGARFTASSRAVTANPTAANVPVPPTTEALQLPPKKAKKVTKDWQDTGKSLGEFAQEK